MWIDLERIIHSFKTGIACLLGFAIVKALHNYLFFDQWLIVTILVVMCAQISVGSILFKSAMRFLGTFLGSLLAAITILSFGDNDLVFAAVIAVASMMFSYLATAQQSYSDAGTLGAVTTAIILISPTPTLALTSERFLEITIGILVATLISQFILPIHARDHLRRSQAQAIHLLGGYYRAVVSEPKLTPEKLSELDNQIVESLRTQHKQAIEARRELLGSRFEPRVFQKTMDAEKYILRGISFLSRVYPDFVQHLQPENQEHWRAFNQSMISVFDNLAKRYGKSAYIAQPIELPALDGLKTNGGKNSQAAHAVFFCLENIRQQLSELIF